VDGVLAQGFDRAVVLVVVHHEHLAGQLDAREDPIEAGDHGVTLLEDGNDDRDPRRLLDHTRTPPSRRFQMSTTGTSVSKSRYIACGVAITRRSDSASTASNGERSSSTCT